MAWTVYQASRWGFSVLAGYVTMAIMLTALHTAPLPREFLGFTPERNNFFGSMAPDRQWLGFTQHVSEKVLTTGRIFDGMVIRGDKAVWVTFPIRYAHLRVNYERGGGMTTSGPPHDPADDRFGRRPRRGLLDGDKGSGARPATSRCQDDAAGWGWQICKQSDKVPIVGTSTCVRDSV